MQRNIRPVTLQSRLFAGIAACLLLVLAGCAHHSQAGSTGPTSLGSNPAPGQPNHMTPDMQAQMQRYKAIADQQKK